MPHIETRNFARWLIRSFKIGTLFTFPCQKIATRLRFKRAAYGRRYYPAELDDVFVRAAASETVLNWALPATSAAQAGADAAVDAVKLASLTVPTRDGGIDWRRTFSDPEDTESLHRWNWMLTLLTQS